MPCGAGCRAFVVGGECLRVSDVDIEIIKQLLDSVPEAMEIRSISFVGGYSLELIAGTQELYNYEKEQTLNEMIRLLNHYKKLDIGNTQLAIKD